MKEYKVISAKWVELLLEELYQSGNDGWTIQASFQEHGVTKILLEKETNNVILD